MKSLYLFLAIGLFMFQTAFAADDRLTVAVFDFSHTGQNFREVAPKVTALLTAHLTTQPEIMVVERANLKKSLSEQELGVGGNITSDTAAKIGQLTGAKVLISGRVFKAENKDNALMVVASLIGTETGRMYSETVRELPPYDLNRAATNLAQKIVKMITENAANFVTEREPREQRLERILKTATGNKRPSVLIAVTERFRDSSTNSAAVETELGFILMKAGFVVVDEKSQKKPDVEITGTAVSSVGAPRGNMFPCRATIEVKLRATATGTILGFDRQSSEAVDIGAETGVTTALEKAADGLAEKLLPLLSK
ncbi:MAG: curli assembly protein CsgG [Verrucomicrobiales bacterium]|nr:curli assembly protein CsgG [Verrucomicrobiales bacterium]